MMYDEFNLAVFQNPEVLHSKIELFNQMILLEKLDISKNKVLTFIMSNYKLSSDVEKRIKISDLLKHFNESRIAAAKRGEVSKPISILQLAQYLIELGLEKKRYSDGMYYYGLEPNTHKNFYDLDYNTDINMEHMFENSRFQLQKLLASNISYETKMTAENIRERFSNFYKYSKKSSGLSEDKLSEIEELNTKISVAFTKKFPDFSERFINNLYTSELEIRQKFIEPKDIFIHLGPPPKMIGLDGRFLDNPC